MNPIDFEECLKDSPAYRTQLRQAANHIDILEDHLEQMFKTCNSMINNGKIFLQDFQKFSKTIFDIRDLFSIDELAYKSLGKFANYLREIHTLFSNLLEQTSHNILKSLNRMLKEDIKKVKDQGKLFERLSSDYDLALQKNADTSKTKSHLCDESSKLLLATRSCFGHTSIDYTYQINVLFTQHKFELIDLVLAYINYHKAFFHQGYELLAIETERDFHMIITQLAKIKQNSIQNQKDLEKHHETNQKRCKFEDEILSTDLSLSSKDILRRNSSQHSLNENEHIKEGYLFKRSHNKFKTWNRRWFLIRQGQLLYMKRTNDNVQQQNSLSILIADLRLCTVRLFNDNDRRFVFEIISPNITHLLQADSQNDCEQWINALQNTIANLFKTSNQDRNLINEKFPKSTIDERSKTLLTAKLELKQQIIKEKIDYVRSLPGNDKCCDCNAENPEWASINLGILFCLNCSGAHRGLGVNLSKVRSLHMDSWDLETLLVMSELGNTIVNSIYESQISNEYSKPNSETDAVTRRTYIEVKYVQKLFLRPLPINTNQNRTIRRWSLVKTSLLSKSDENKSPTKKFENEFVIWNENIYLYEGARQRNVSMMLHALTLGAEKNFANEYDHKRTPLIQAVLSRSVAAAEFLLTNNANVNLADEDGKTPLHFATELAMKSRGPIILLLKRGADPLLKDNHNIDCCSLSMDIGDPDVITWYRLIALHEQMKVDDADVEKSYISILDDPVYMKEIARTPSFS